MSLLSVTWPAILVLPLLWLVKDRISANKALRQAGADTPAMREAVQLHAQAERETQRAKLGLKVWFFEKLPSGEIRRTEVTNLKAVEPPKVEPPHVEDPAA